MEIKNEDFREIIDDKLVEEVEEDEYEKYCFVCRRPESKVGKMITMMEGMFICPDCMQKTMDAVSASPLKLDQFTQNSDDLEMPKGPNISMINLADLQSLMGNPRQKVKKKKGDKKAFEHAAEADDDIFKYLSCSQHFQKTVKYFFGRRQNIGAENLQSAEDKP